MCRRSTLSALSVALLVVFAVPVALAFDLPPNDGFVTDAIPILTETQEQTLEEKLQAYEKETSNQIAVLIVHTLSGADIAETGVETMRTWGIGQKNKNNGVLMLVAYDDHMFWTTTGYGLEGALPDIVVKGIFEKDISPSFKDGNYYEGIDAGIDAMKKHIGGEFTADRYAENAGSNFFVFFLFFLFIIFNVLSAVLAKSRSWWMGGVLGAFFGLIFTIAFSWWLSIPLLIIAGLLFDFIVSKIGPRRGGRRGGGFGGFGGMGGGGGGGFGGFGGGSSGGGGAGGSW